MSIYQLNDSNYLFCEICSKKLDSMDYYCMECYKDLVHKMMLDYPQFVNQAKMDLILKVNDEIRDKK